MSRGVNKRGRPRADRIDTVLRVMDFLDVHPGASAASVARELRIRKAEAQRIVRELRGRERRFPKLGGQQ